MTTETKKILYRETVVRWVTVDLGPEHEHSPLDEIEDTYREAIFEQVAGSDWDGEDVLENFFEVVRGCDL